MVEEEYTSELAQRRSVLLAPHLNSRNMLVWALLLLLGMSYFRGQDGLAGHAFTQRVCCLILFSAFSRSTAPR